MKSQIIARIAPGVASLDAAAWDLLAGRSDPFLSHAFLAAPRAVGQRRRGDGLDAAPILVEGESGALLPPRSAYLKSHSQGEYVFDYGWADALERAGRQYIRSCRSPCRSRRCRAGGCSALRSRR